MNEPRDGTGRSVRLGWKPVIDAVLSEPHRQRPAAGRCGLVRRGALGWAAALLIMGVLISGCSKSNDAQTQRPKYEVADEGAAQPSATAAAGKAGGAPPSAADTVEPGMAGPGMAGEGQPGSVPGGQPLAQPPSLSSDQLGGGSETMVPDGTPEELYTFIETIQQQVRSLTENRPAPGTENSVLAKLRSLCEAEVKAADKILATKPEQPLRGQAADARMHGMQFLTRLDPTPERMQDLRAFAQQLAVDSDPELSLKGRVILLGLRVGDLRQQPNPDVKGLMNELQALLADERRSGDVLNVAQQAYMTLQMLGHHEEADEAFTLIASAFKDHQDPAVAAEAANMLKELKIRETGFDAKLDAVARKDPNSVEPFLAALKVVLTQAEPSEMTLDRVMGAVAMLEQTGQYGLGVQVCELIRPVFEQHANEQLRLAATENLNLALKRLQLVGQLLVVDGTTLGGSPLDFAKYKGKVVLIDFWATWCGPCLAELPNLRKNYDLYHNVGFEVIGVNLDQDREAVTRFLQSEPLPWTTVVNNELADRCGVESIPFIILLDRNGMVIDLHVRGESLGRKLRELLGPVEPKSPVNPVEPVPAGKLQSRLSIPLRSPQDAALAVVAVAGDEQLVSAETDELWWVSADGDAPAEPPSPDAELELPEVDEEANPYLAPAGLSPMELVTFLLDMQEKPRSIRRRPGFNAAIVDAANRVLAADTKDRYQVVAALAKFTTLHQAAQLGDEAADRELWAFTEKLQGDPRPELASQVAFFQLEHRVMQSGDLPLADVPALLAELNSWFDAQPELTARHLRLASETVRTINRLEDEAQREKYFGQFGTLFARSSDPQLARYGKKLMGGKATASELVGKPLELAGETAAGTVFNWADYRGKIVVVDFWATWCGPCRREMGQLKTLEGELQGQAFAVVGVNLDEDSEALAEYLDEQKVAWENLLGSAAQELATRCGVRSIPTMILVDAQGTVVTVSRNVADLKPHITRLLAAE